MGEEEDSGAGGNLEEMGGIWNTIKIYFILTKPRLWSLLVYAGVAGYLIASKGSIDLTLFILFISLLAGTAGANMITSYIDLDIDRIMIRTRKRPLPRGLINPPHKALIFGFILSGIAIATSYYINITTLALMLFGLFDNIVIYSILSKRRTPWNIILGSFSGGATIAMGYAAYFNNLPLEGIILAGLIVIWTPLHIWSLALYWKDDYIKAGVPMLTAILDEKAAIRCLGFSAIILVIFSLILPVFGGVFTNLIYLILVSILDFVILYFSFKLIMRPERRTAWILFKLTSPYLFLVLTILILLSMYM